MLLPEIKVKMFEVKNVSAILCITDMNIKFLSHWVVTKPKKRDRVVYVTDLGMYDRKQFYLIKWIVLVHYVLYREMALFFKVLRD